MGNTIDLHILEYQFLFLLRLHGLWFHRVQLSAHHAKPSREELELAEASKAALQREQIEEAARKKEEELAKILSSEGNRPSSSAIVTIKYVI